MYKKAYIINFDKGGLLDSFDYEKFHSELTSAKGLVSWFHYLKSSYIIIVENGVTATKIYNFIKERMPNKYFFICELNLTNHNGWLPKEAWDWINRYRYELY